jgi:hypothetical protein
VAILQISRIQHRRGTSDNLPQLSAAELGWSVDNRKLYIGNGTLEEGAPILGNTEILTEFSDLLNTSQSYTYKGEAAGYTATTGTSSSSPVERTLQRKFDDFVNVRDFGAVGDGTTDDTAAINRALYQLYCREVNEEIRRALYFPAGVYKITGDVVKIPTYAKIIGEGAESTIIKQTDSGEDYVFKLADSLQQVDAGIATNAATRPQYIEVSGCTFWNSTTNHVGLISSAQHIHFDDVKFKGNLTLPTVVTDAKADVHVESTAILTTEHVTFDNCYFTNNTFGVEIDYNCRNIVIQNSYWDELYKGVKLGESLTGISPQDEGPRGFKITNSYFDRIANMAIHAYGTVKHVVSAFNYFYEVGNAYNGAGNEASPIIYYVSEGNFSIGDQFERNDADDLNQPRLQIDNVSSYGMIADNSVAYGAHRQEAGLSVTLTDNTAVAATTGITLSDSKYTHGAIIDYSIVRGTTYRTGTLKIGHGTSVGYSDDYSEDSSTGVALTVTFASNTSTINYTTTSTGSNATMKYSIRYLY